MLEVEAVHMGGRFLARLFPKQAVCIFSCVLGTRLEQLMPTASTSASMRPVLSCRNLVWQCRGAGLGDGGVNREVFERLTLFVAHAAELTRAAGQHGAPQRVDLVRTALRISRQVRAPPHCCTRLPLDADQSCWQQAELGLQDDLRLVCTRRDAFKPLKCVDVEQKPS